MPHYIKSCVICGEQFYTTRLSKNYCKKKCANAARSYRAAILQALIDKASKATQVVEIVPKSVRDFMIRNANNIITPNGGILREGDTKIPEHIRLAKEISVSGISGTDAREIALSGIKLRDERRKNELEKQFLDDNNTGNNTTDNKQEVLTDPEMANFNLDAMVNNSSVAKDEKNKNNKKDDDLPILNIED